MDRIDHRVAIVTGGTRGIGAAITTKLARAPARGPSPGAKRGAIRSRCSSVAARETGFGSPGPAGWPVGHDEVSGDQAYVTSPDVVPVS
jgi:NAD(P)-dependent dehydrogenase (short-subunit alcohol dehydrogenase family)